jgi:isopentenyl diphosphate isomerase/L-lactate dehydrogenase-like FMN-dependent dehydrogenase
MSLSRMSLSRITDVADAQRIASRRIPRSVYQAFARESGTAKDNRRALGEVGFRPRVATRFDHHELATTILGRPSAMPVIASPVGGLRLAHRDAEVGLAAAAGAIGIPVGVSTSAHHRVEDVARATSGPVWYQLYLAGGRAAAEGAIERADACGCAALVLTVDMLGAGMGTRAGSARNQVPNRITVENAWRYAPEMLVRPRWFVDYAREGLRLQAANVRPHPEGPPLDFSEALPISPTWDDVDWIKELWPGPLVIKGVIRTDDARRAADAGADAVVVSNHGGLVLDGVPGSLRSLPAVVEAVGDQVEVLFDGGVRSGPDVVKALGLGARAVLCGRSCVWGLAAGGSDGARRVLELLHDEIEVTLAELGCPSVHEVQTADLDLPYTWPARLPVG